MRIGFVFECAKDGPDKKVYLALIKRLQQAGEIGNFEPDSVTLINLPGLKAGCGDSATTFFLTGCERVFICWDLFPSHSQDEPVCTDQRAEIEATLRTSGVDMDKIHFVCIRRELESWLIVDGAAICALWNPNRGRPPAIPHENEPDNHPNPRKRLSNLIKNELNRGKYEAHYDAVKIAEQIDLRRLARSQSFCHFVCRLRRVAPGTKATICSCEPVD